MSSKQENKGKTSILGSARFSFITSIAAKSLNNDMQNKTQIDYFSSECSTDTEKDKQSMTTETDEETISNKINPSSDISLLSNFNAELNLEKKENEEKTTIENQTKYLFAFF